MTQSRRALIVEDDLDDADLIAAILETEGFTSTIAVEGQEGFRIATSEAFDLAVVDITLPGWDGYEMMNSLSLVQEQLPILVVSGKPPEEIRSKVSHPNVIDVIQKPFSLDRIRETLAKIK